MFACNLFRQPPYCLQKILTHPLHKRYGLPRRPKFLNTELHKIKIPNKYLTSHIFRHTYVSLAVEQGIDKDTIARQVGHANTKMIDGIYLFTRYR